MRFLRLWQLVGNDLRLLWFALRHPDRPLWLIPVVAILGIYALDPLNFTLPVVGMIDEFIIIPLALHLVLRCLPLEIRGGYAARFGIPRP